MGGIRVRCATKYGVSYRCCRLKLRVGVGVSNRSRRLRVRVRVRVRALVRVRPMLISLSNLLLPPTPPSKR